MSDTRPTKTKTKYIHNPTTGEIVAEQKHQDEADLTAAVDQAREAQADWYGSGLTHRSRIIRAVAPLIADRAKVLTDIISATTGKPRVDALGTELLPAALLCRYYPRLAKRTLRLKRIKGSSVLFFNKRSLLVREPYGVIGIISPWNYPLGIPMHELVQALLAGNTVVLKVATQSQPVGEAMIDLFRDAGLPEGVLNLVHLPGSEAGKAFIRSGIDKLLFTGSTEVGRRLMAEAADRLLPLSLELGGNDPMIVLRDARLSRAVDGAIWAGLSNSGQSCAAIERIYVEEPVYEQFLDLLKHRINRLRFGVELGALTTSSQLKTIEAFVQDARKRGATVWTWNAQRSTIEDTRGEPPYIHRPVVIENAEESMLVHTGEIFGPVLAVRKVKNAEEALHWANDSRLGLCASIWTENRRLARQLATRLQVGVVMFNDHLMSHGMPETPWGGYKQSSLGRCHGELGFYEVTQAKVVVDDLLPRLPRNFWWLPYANHLEEGISGGIDALFVRSPGRRLRGLLRLLRIFLASFKQPGD
jgi:succinate-semialdehyde dehydrogenase/glutarate-semialdehyde dehydrogenase